MSMLVRGGRNALALGATIAAIVLFGTVCSVDDTGLSGASGGAGGKGSGGSAGHTGGHGGGTAGSGSGGGPGTGGTVVIGTGGHGSGGFTGSGGMLGTGGTATGGTLGSGGSGTGGTGTGGSGTGGSAGSGGTAGTGGVAGGAGNGSGGVAGSGGIGGMNAAGGSGGSAGSPATGGRGGHPSCASFPSGASLTTPTDGRLHCYWVHGSQIDWNSAEAVCENEGGKLVSILSETENNTVVQLALQANLFMGIGMTGQVFIGATDGLAVDDRSGAGTYSWVTGEPWGYQNWHTGQPDGACTGCSGPGPSSGCACDHRGAITSDGTWYDRTETTMRPFVCEAVAP